MMQIGEFNNGFQSLQDMTGKIEHIDSFPLLYGVLLITIKVNLLETTGLNDFTFWRGRGEMLKQILVKQMGYVRTLQDKARIEEFESLNIDDDKHGNA